MAGIFLTNIHAVLVEPVATATAGDEVLPLVKLVETNGTDVLLIALVTVPPLPLPLLPPLTLTLSISFLSYFTSVCIQHSTADVGIVTRHTKEVMIRPHSVDGWL